MNMQDCFYKLGGIAKVIIAVTDSFFRLGNIF